jgi:antitoxin CptB
VSDGADPRRKRLRIRSWRRGTREMDLILGKFADSALPGLEPAALDRFERLLDHDDNDLYLWVSGRQPPPPEHAEIIHTIRIFHRLS